MDTPEAKKLVTEVKVSLPSGGEVIVKKLKAGKFYEAQKLYVEWLETLQKLLIKDAIKEDGTADTDKIQGALTATGDVQVADLLKTVGEADKIRLSLLAFCLETSEEQMNEAYFPEDIEALFKEVIAVNDFLVNLGKSVYLTAGNVSPIAPAK